MRETRQASGAVRPGGRTARTRAAVLDAARDELEDAGYAGLTLERVAERSGVHLATLYRRWRTVEGLVVDLLGEIGKTRVPIPDTGSLEEDLRILALEIARLYQQPRMRALIEGVVAAAVRSPEASDAWATVIAERNRLAARIVERAVERGELPPGTDGIAVISAVGAPIYYRMLVARGAVDDALAESTAVSVHAGALKGAFTRPAGDPPADGTPSTTP
ncbi:TetR/AcrR family transcriptional regulator [Actinomadura rugatobispora]|uniref:TetR/AcrR family transcriptional regulator n=1 Tax=Actinomadura rugatobispora TaxID=1994 RepID=A0ABW1AF89_9ACTN|nr:TetR/AcrR family transcriptional regulator [Actinomadura rugatobispora]